MIVFWQVLIGLLTTFVLGLGVPRLLKSVQKEIPLIPPSEETKKKWEELTAGNEGGRMRIPAHAGHRFRRMPGQHSIPCRATVPAMPGRLR